MRILKLALTNYKRFDSVTIDLDRPLTVLVGRNNSGKSTILEIAGHILGATNFSGNILSRKMANTGTVQAELSCRFTEEEWKNALALVSHEFVAHEKDISTMPTLISGLTVVFRHRMAFVKGQQTSNEKTARPDDESQMASMNEIQKSIFMRTIQNLVHQNLAVLAGVMFVSAERRIQRDERFIPFNEFQSRGDRNELIRNALYFLKEKGEKNMQNSHPK